MWKKSSSSLKNTVWKAEVSCEMEILKYAVDIAEHEACLNERTDLTLFIPDLNNVPDPVYIFCGQVPA